MQLFHSEVVSLVDKDLNTIYTQSLESDFQIVILECQYKCGFPTQILWFNPFRRGALNYLCR